jgi:hypothetical protein
MVVGSSERLEQQFSNRRYHMPRGNSGPLRLSITDKREVRHRMDVKLTRLAQLTGYSLSHMSRVFSLDTTPSLSCLTSLANAVSMDIAVFWDHVQNRRFNVFFNHIKESKDAKVGGQRQ